MKTNPNKQNAKGTRTSTARAEEEGDDQDQEEAEDMLPGLAYTRCHEPFTAASKSKAGEAAAVADVEGSVLPGGERYCFCGVGVCVCIGGRRRGESDGLLCPLPPTHTIHRACLYPHVHTWKPRSSAPMISRIAACCPRVALRPRSVVSMSRSSSISSVRRSATASRACAFCQKQKDGMGHEYVWVQSHARASTQPSTYKNI